MSRPAILGLRGRLVFLLTLALLPALGLLLFDARNNRATALSESQQTLTQLVALSVNRQTQAIESVRALLTGLSTNDLLLVSSADVCDDILRRAHRDYPGLTGIFAAERDGTMRCASVPRNGVLSVVDRSWFQDMLRRQTFTVGEYRIGSVSNRPVIVASYPITQNNQLRGAVFSGVDLNWLNQLVADASALGNATIVLTDRNGTLLGAYPPTPDLIGRSDATMVEHISANQRLFQAKDALGTERIYALEPLQAANSTIGYVSVGLPITEIFAAADRQMIERGVALLAVFGLALMAVWFGGELLIVRPAQLLLRATEALARGERGVQSGVRHDQSEIGRLGYAFDSMSTALDAQNAALTTSEQRFRLLAENAQDLIYRYHYRPTPHIEYVSPSAKALLGYPPEAFYRDQTLFDQIINLEDRARLRAQIARSGSFVGPVLLRWRRRDGQEIWSEHRLSVGRDAHGNPVTVEGVGRDVSERMAAEAQRQQERELLQTVFNYAPLRIALCDAHGVPIMTNTAWDQAYVNNHDVPAVLHELMQQADGRWHDVANTGEPETPQLAWAVVRLSDAHRIVFGQDISERRRNEEYRLQMERRLQESQRLESLGILAGGIAHDFNNLLMAMLGNAGLMREELPSNSPVQHSLAQIETAARRAADLTRQMLAYAGKGRFVVQRVALNSLIHELLHLLQASIPKHITLRYQLFADLPPIEADVTQMRQIIMNLVVNAAEAIGTRSGTITLTTRQIWGDREYLSAMLFAQELPEGEYVVLEVSDDGVGMDPATVGRIFEPFFTTKFTGRGLGLAAVLGIVRGHGGAIHVHSAIERGSLFRVLLPAATGVAVALEGPAGLATWRGDGLVLLIDDDAEVREVGGRMLERMGFTVVTAADGAAGLRWFQRYAATLRCVLLDIAMPQIGGEDVILVIQQQRPDLPVVVMSGYHESDMRARFAHHQPAGFIQKPFTPSELRAVLARMLRQSVESDESAEVRGR